MERTAPSEDPALDAAVDGASRTPRPDERGIPIQLRVDAAADGLLQRGEALTVRAVRALTGGDANAVAAAFKAWRQNLWGRLQAGAPPSALPSEVLRYVQLGYQAALTLAEQQRLDRLPPDRAVLAERDGLRRALSAADARCTALEDERAVLFEKNGALLGRLDAQRVRLDHAERRAKLLQGRLDAAHLEIGTLNERLAATSRPRRRSTPKTAPTPVSRGSSKKRGAASARTTARPTSGPPGTKVPPRRAATTRAKARPPRRRSRTPVR